MLKNYRPADCCMNCFNLDATEPPEEEFFCSIFHDPVNFDYVCDDFTDSAATKVTVQQYMGKFDAAIEAVKEA